MEFENIIVDPIHIFNDENYTVQRMICENRIYVVEEKDSHQLFFMIKKGEKYISDNNNSLINQLEKLFDLIHPSITHLVGYSVKKPYIYYQYLQEPQIISNITLSDENIQKIFIGIASGLSYLLSKGYYYCNLSLDCIILDENCYPKLIDYVDLEGKNSSSEKDLIIKYADLLQEVLKDKIEKNSVISLNEELKSLVERCKQKTNIPTFDDFINVFISTLSNSNFFYQKNLNILRPRNKKVSDDIRHFESIEQVYDYFFNKHIKKLADKDLFILNSLPESYIKSLVNVSPALSKKLKRYLYNEDISLIIPDWKILCDSNLTNPFKIYKVIMEKMKSLKSISNKPNNEPDYKIEALRIQAIFFLKEAVKNSTDSKINIELAVQYIKGDILPYNLNKALKILDQSPNTADQKTKKLLDQMKERTRSAINSTSVENMNLGEYQRNVIQKAAKNNVLFLTYAGFNFFTGHNEFPISRSLAIQYYRTAASQSADAMAFLGYLYFNGIFFPQNLKRARNCFRRAAEKGSLKAEIIDSLIRKHVWRSYLVDFDINYFFSKDYIRSLIPNDSLIFPKIVYNLEKNLNNNKNYILKLIRKDNILESSNENSMVLEISETENWDKKIKPMYSEKNILNHENIDNIENVSKQLYIAKSFYFGINNFPVNYTKAAEFFKLAADNGNSEAQWRYALLIINSLGVNYELNSAYNYLEKSSKSDIIGKLHFALFVKKYYNNTLLFEKLIKECCKANNVEAMYQYAIYLEKSKSTLQNSIKYYKKAKEKEHIDSLIRLINIVDNQSQEYLSLMELSIGMFNETILIKLIDFLNGNANYEESNIFIQIGLSINKKLFDSYYTNHLLCGELTINNKKKLIKITNQGFQKDPNRYFCLVLHALVVNNEHEKALNFLLKNQDILDEKQRSEFHLFYKKFDERLARKYFIPAYFYYKDFRYCHNLMMEYHIKNENFMYIFSELTKYARDEHNSFAFAIVGKIYKSEKLVSRDLNTAIKYFAQSAKFGCTLGYYYLGKEYFYGRYLKVNYLKAHKYLLLALKDEPHAGYYLYKILKHIHHQSPESGINYLDFSIKMLKIGVEFGHKRALYKYGQILYKGDDENNKSKGIKLIQQASFKKYNKAIKFCIAHGISFKEDRKDDDSILEDDEKEKIKSCEKIELVERNIDSSSLEDMNNSENSKPIKSKHTKSINLIDIENQNDVSNEKEEKNTNLANNEDENLSDIMNFWS